MTNLNCLHVEELISEYIENTLPGDLHDEVSQHLETCNACRKLKGKVETLMSDFPDLEEDVPFFLKNRLYYIPESQDNVIVMPVRRPYVRWIAAAVAVFALFLNVFYFTNIYPPANRIVHSIVSGLETFAVKTEAFYEKVNESGKTIFMSSLDPEVAQDDDDKPMGKKIDKNGGNNG